MVNRPVRDWCLVVPVKRLAVAKSRLGGIAAPRRAELAVAFALDTVEAALACPGVRAVVAVTDEAAAAVSLEGLGALVVADEPDSGLNPALVHGAAAAVRAHPRCGVGALSADLPALRPSELARALGRAAVRDACFVTDVAGTGTTLLLARHPDRFLPSFGAGSAARHAAAGAVDVTGDDLPSLRRDVDTLEDLREAESVGLGPRTGRLLRELLPDAARGESAR